MKVWARFTPDSDSSPDTAASRTPILKSRARSSSLQRRPVCWKYAMLPEILKQGRLFEDIERDVSEIEKSVDSTQPAFSLQQGATNRLENSEKHHSYKGRQNLKPPFRQSRDTPNKCHNCSVKWPHQGGRSGFPAWGKTCNACNKATSIRVFPYKATSPLELLGKVAVTMRYKDKCIEEDIFVIPGCCAPPLSFTAASNLGLVQITYQVHEQLDDKSIVEAFPKLFRGVGKLKNQHIHLFVDETVTPVALPHRRIPFALRAATEKEFERLLSEDIIEPASDLHRGCPPW
ncbi:hypothetical protein MTO96_000132 [Rhipicephalus appendiculatus]